MLEEQHRIIVADRCFQEALGVVGIGRHNHFQSRHVGKVGLNALGVVQPTPDA